MPQPRAKTREELKAQIKGRRMSDRVGVAKTTKPKPTKPKTEQQRIIASGITRDIRNSWDKYMGPKKVSRKSK